MTGWGLSCHCSEIVNNLRTRGSELHFVLGCCPAVPGPVWGLAGTGRFGVITKNQVKHLVYVDVPRAQKQTVRPKAARQAGLSVPYLNWSERMPHTPLL